MHYLYKMQYNNNIYIFSVKSIQFIGENGQKRTPTYPNGFLYKGKWIGGSGGNTYLFILYVY